MTFRNQCLLCHVDLRTVSMIVWSCLVLSVNDVCQYTVTFPERTTPVQSHTVGVCTPLLLWHSAIDNVMIIQRKTTLNVATDFSYFSIHKPRQLRCISCERNKEDFKYFFVPLCSPLPSSLICKWKIQIKVTRHVSHSAAASCL